jgi:hypothetical protein
MADQDEVTLRQADGDALRLAHQGEVHAEHHGVLRVSGDAKAEALQHRVGAELVHATPPDRPLVHMMLWDDDRQISGRLTISGDPAAPIDAKLHHRFENEHRQTHRFETTLSAPVHHALQMRTPLQVRFCNTWQIASDYSLEIRLGDNRVIGVHLTGATVARPLPCPDDADCAEPVITHPMHP